MDKMEKRLRASLRMLNDEGRLKGEERRIAGIIPARAGSGPRVLLEGHGDRQFIAMNSNSYLGLSRHPEVLRAGEEAAAAFGAGPGAVRFISGTSIHHSRLEERLAAFHGRESAMIFSAAYAAVMGLLPPLVTGETHVVSDELNHNCIISAVRLARPASKAIYRHLDMRDLERALQTGTGAARVAIVVTDGVFSMRGDCAPLRRIAEICRESGKAYADGVVTIVDDSHGVGALGENGRGTEEHTGGRADILVATLGKALGVNGGYVASSATTIEYLRETSPFYVYSNPITPAEAAAATRALEILDSPEGRERILKLRSLTRHLEDGLRQAGFEVLPGPHPIVPLMVRDSSRTAALIEHLFERGVLATGLNYPVVPRGDEEIRFQVSAEQTPADIDCLLDAIRAFKGLGR